MHLRAWQQYKVNVGNLNHHCMHREALSPPLARNDHVPLVSTSTLFQGSPICPD